MLKKTLVVLRAGFELKPFQGQNLNLAAQTNVVPIFFFSNIYFSQIN